MNELLKALANLPPVKKKIHTVTIQGKTIEVSLERIAEEGYTWQTESE